MLLKGPPPKNDIKYFVIHAVIPTAQLFVHKII